MREKIIQIKKNNNDQNSKNLNNNYNIKNNSSKELQIYYSLKEFNERYNLNSNNSIYRRKIKKDDENDDEDEIIFDDINNNNFYSPYNKTAIFINQQRFVTPYDIHDTMVYLVSNDYHWKSKKGQSLTEEINGLKRNCEIYIDDFDNQTIKEYCHCIPFQ